MVTRSVAAVAGRVGGWKSVVNRWLTVVGLVVGLSVVLTPLLLSIPLLSRLLFSGRIGNASVLLSEALFNISLPDLLSLIRFHQHQGGLTWPSKPLALPSLEQRLNGSAGGKPSSTVHCHLAG